MKSIKVILALVLSVVMILTMTAPAMAAVDESVVCPEIYVPGFYSTALYADKDDTDTLLSIPDKDTIIKAVKDEIVPAFIVYAANKDAYKLGSAISDVTNSMLEDWFNNSDGTAKDNSGANFVYPAAENIKNNSKIRFAYDWRCDPIESAAELNDFINYVLDCTDKDKVALSCHSLGAVVVLTYISIYGSDKIMGIAFDSPAIEGLTSVGELFSGRTDFEAEGIAALLKMIIGTTEYEELLSSIIDIFSMAGINGSISDFLDNAYDEVGAVFFTETLVPLFGCWPSVWTMIPDEYIEAVMADIFANEFAGSEYDAIKTKIQNYNTLVRADKIKTLTDFDAAGRVAVVSRYGYNAVPMTSQWSMLSDTVIETKNSSFGATTAKIGEYFTDEELAGKDMKYISPDKTVDASTCIFKEKTWFIKNAVHTDSSIASGILSLLLFASEESTCDNSELSRFMIYDKENGTITTDESVPEKAEKPTMLSRIFNFIKALINKLLDLFRR